MSEDILVTVTLTSSELCQIARALETEAMFGLAIGVPHETLLETKALVARFIDVLEGAKA